MVDPPQIAWGRLPEPYHVDLLACVHSDASAESLSPQICRPQRFFLLYHGFQKRAPQAWTTNLSPTTWIAALRVRTVHLSQKKKSFQLSPKKLFKRFPEQRDLAHPLECRLAETRNQLHLIRQLQGKIQSVAS
jgi:hypothetical protein